MPNRKPRGSLSSPPVTNKTTPSQTLPPGKPASKRSKVKTPLAEGKPSLLEPVASTSHHVASTLKPLKETHSTSITLPTQTAVEVKQTADRSDQAPVTLQCTDEVSTGGIEAVLIQGIHTHSHGGVLFALSFLAECQYGQQLSRRRAHQCVSVLLK